MNKAVFLDRDGVINLEVGDYIQRVTDFKVLPHAIQNIKKLVENNYKIIVITNQGGIAKGLYSLNDLAIMHQLMIEEVEKGGGKFDEIYFCPHHPESGACLCRKPGSLMVEKGIAKYNIDPKQSVFIGDKERDIVAANGAGVRGVLIHENQDWSFVVDELLNN